MVKQDYAVAVAQATAREKRMQEKKQSEPAPKETSSSAPRGWLVVAVQSIACAVILLLALFVRIGGGSAYDELRRGFGDSLRSNDLMAALARLWDGDPTATLTSEPPSENETPQESSTDA